MMKKFFVEACASTGHAGALLDGDKVVPIHSHDNPNGGFSLLKVGDAPMEVFDSTTIRRALRDGDLRVVEKADQPATARSAASGK